MCEAIYMGNNQKTFTKRMGGYFFDLLRFLKNGQKSDSFAVLYGQHFNATMSFTGLRKYMNFKEIKQLHLIGAMEPLVYLTAIYVYRNS